MGLMKWKKKSKKVLTPLGQVLPASELENQLFPCSSLLLVYATGISLYFIGNLHSRFAGTGINQQKLRNGFVLQDG